MVRTDSKTQKLDAFLQPTNKLSSVPIAHPPKPVSAIFNFEAKMNEGPKELLASATNVLETDVQLEAAMR